MVHMKQRISLLESSLKLLAFRLYLIPSMAEWDVESCEYSEE